MRAGNATVGLGKIITIQELWGRPYTTEPQPADRQQLVNLLAGQGIIPAVAMTSTQYVGAFLHQNQDSLIVHFVNYDYHPETDAITSTYPLGISLTVPDGFPQGQISARMYAPGLPSQALDITVNGDLITFTLPGINVWRVVQISAGVP